jgi:hypothetical protein
VVVGPDVDASPNQELPGGIVRLGLNSSKKAADADGAGGIVRFGFGSERQ